MLSGPFYTSLVLTIVSSRLSLTILHTFLPYFHKKKNIIGAYVLFRKSFQELFLNYHVTSNTSFLLTTRNAKNVFVCVCVTTNPKLKSVRDPPLCSICVVVISYQECLT